MAVALQGPNAAGGKALVKRPLPVAPAPQSIVSHIIGIYVHTDHPARRDDRNKEVEREKTAL